MNYVLDCLLVDLYDIDNEILLKSATTIYDDSMNTFCIEIDGLTYAKYTIFRDLIRSYTSISYTYIGYGYYGLICEDYYSETGRQTILYYLTDNDLNMNVDIDIKYFQKKCQTGNLIFWNKESKAIDFLIRSKTKSARKLVSI